MNVLIPNIAWTPAYSVAVSLRDHCDVLVGTVDPPMGMYRIGRGLFDHIYSVVFPDSSQHYPQYVEKMVDICARHHIQIIFPSNDTEMRVLNLYAGVLNSHDIKIISSPFTVLSRAQDKFEVLEAARAVNFPCPKTSIYWSESKAMEFADEVGFPLVLKTANSRGSLGVRFVANRHELLCGFEDLDKMSGRVLMQEYIPGNKERSLNFFFDQNGNVLHKFVLRKMHYLRPSLSTSIEIVDEPPEMKEAAALARSLGIVGFCAIQTKVDRRDGRHKLIELNPRFGNNARILFNLGVNIPLIWLESATGTIQKMPQKYSVGLSGVSPFEDFLAFVSYLWCRYYEATNGSQLDTVGNPVPSLLAFLQSYVKLYEGKPRFDQYSTRLFKDPIGVLDYYFRALRKYIWLPRYWSGFMPWGECD